MNTLPNNGKIEKYLNELSDEYKELLLNALLEQSHSIDEISICDLLRLDQEIKKPLIENYQRLQKKRKIFFVSGTFYVFLGIFIMITYYLINSDIFYSVDGVVQLVSIVIGTVGLFISVFSLIMPLHSIRSSTRKSLSQDKTIKLLSFEVITKWRELEGVVNDLAENCAMPTSRSILEYLSNNNFIDKEEANILKDFLKIRNSVAHSIDINYSVEQVKMSIKKVSQIIEKLKKIL